MSKKILQLYPSPYRKVSLHGLYLSLRLNTKGTAERPFVYANFVTSLDGRTGLYNPLKKAAFLPKQLTSENDHRLFLELQAQCECLITHGGYLRDLQRGSLGNILQVGTRQGTQDLADWRIAEGLKPQPDIFIASASLEFTIPKTLEEHGQKCYIVTTANADIGKIKKWERQGYAVFKAGNGDFVEGKPLIDQLKGLGYKSAYLIAGSRMLATMVNDEQLVRMYKTITHQFLGGENFHTVIQGSELGHKGNLKLISLYYDQESPAGCGQWFAEFDVAACVIRQ